MAKEILNSAELYEKIKKHPEWRVVEGIPGDGDACHPLGFAYHDDGLRFYWDGSATQFHKNATCYEILDAVGEGFDADEFNAPVMIAGFDKNWKEARVCHRVALDESAKWIKIYA